MKNTLFMVLIIGLFILPAAMGASPDPYQVIVDIGQNTALQSTDIDFGSFKAGTINDIDNSFNLTNSGNVVCNVDAQFTTFHGSVYGFNAISGYIAGTNFYMNNTDAITPTWVALTATAVDADMGNILADNIADDWAVRLVAPAGQEAGDYTGTVQLTFSNA